MSWVLFSILAALIWAVVNVVDKYILKEWVEKPSVPVIFVGTFGLIAAFFIYLFHGFSALSLINIALAFVAGAFYILMVIFYFQSVKVEEISRVVPLFYLAPLFTAVLAAVFIGETFTPIKYLGIVLLIAGAILISSKNFRLDFGKAFWFMILASLISSIGTVITKYLLNFADFWTVFSYTMLGAFFPLLPLLYFGFPDLASCVKKHGKKVVAALSLNESMGLTGVLFITIAMSTGRATLVNALSSVQPFFVFLFTLILSTSHPKIIKEEIDKSTLLIKLIAITLMFIGANLITF